MIPRPSPGIAPSGQPPIDPPSAQPASPPVQQTVMPQLAENLLANLPDEILHQVLGWVLETEGSESSLDAIARTSRQFEDLVKDYRTSAAYKRLKYQQQTLPWTLDYLRSLHVRLSARSPESQDELRALLRSRPDGARALKIRLGETVISACLEGDGLQSFGQLAFPALSVTLNPATREIDVARQIAGALPPDACMTLVVRNDQEEKAAQMAELVRQVASTGRTTGLIFLRGDDLASDKDALGSVLDTACGPGRLNHIRFNGLDKPGDVLRALAARCESFEFLRLVIIKCGEEPEEADIAHLAEALSARQDRGKSRLTIALHCDAWPDGDPVPEAIAASRTAYEKAGLFFGMVWRDQHRVRDFAEQLVSSVTGGSLPTWRC